MLYGLSDRGTLKVGMLGDVNIIDYENLQLESPFVTSDLPAGGTRLVQGARGYVATIKSGEITFDRGQDTGARPGQLLRGAR
jgi:N-acyl-D-aspartate/D-glutamate deacylase